jgi:hypothetical protein
VLQKKLKAAGRLWQGALSCKQACHAQRFGFGGAPIGLAPEHYPQMLLETVRAFGDASGFIMQNYFANFVVNYIATRGTHSR